MRTVAALALAGSLAFLGASYKLWSDHQKRPPERLPPPAEVGPAAKEEPIDIDALHRVYHENQIVFDGRFKSRVVTVRGCVLAVTATPGGDGYGIGLGDCGFNSEHFSPAYGAARFRPDQKARAGGLRKGQHVVLRGICTGASSNGLVLLHGCEILEVTTPSPPVIHPPDPKPGTGPVSKY